MAPPRPTWLLGGLLYAFFPLDYTAGTGQLHPPAVCGDGAGLLEGGRGRDCHLAAQARETGFLLLGSLGLLALYRRCRDPALAAVLAGCVTPLLAELTYYWITVGNPIQKAAVIQKLNDLHWGAAPEGPTFLFYYPAAMLGLNLEKDSPGSAFSSTWRLGP